VNTVDRAQAILQATAEGRRPRFAGLRLHLLQLLTRHPADWGMIWEGWAMINGCEPRLPWHRRITLKFLRVVRRI